MPVLRIVQAPPKSEFDDLKVRLVKEWQHPDESAREPLIIEEGEIADRPSHLVVIWSDWDDLDDFQRSMVIMLAYEEVYGPDRVLTVSTAEGLTPSEAQRKGTPYAALQGAA